MLTLRPKDRARVIEIIRHYLPDVEILAYGSRVHGACHDGSDLDLALHGPDAQPLPPSVLGTIIEELRESNIPILVEVRDWARLPESFQAEIALHHERI